ncbi:MAG: hypothetical protein ABR608_04285 [Pseudonocardiaceae bacterium]
MSHGSVPRFDEVAGLLAVVLAAFAAARCGTGLLHHPRQRRKLHRKHVDLLRILAGQAATPSSTLWLDVPHPMAYSVVAARSHGTGAVRSALLSMSAHRTPAPGLGMARDCIALRLTLLSSNRPEPSRLHRSLRSGLAGTIAAFVPALASTALLAAGIVTSCPVLG